MKHHEMFLKFGKNCIEKCNSFISSVCVCVCENTLFSLIINIFLRKVVRDQEKIDPTKLISSTMVNRVDLNQSTKIPGSVQADVSKIRDQVQINYINIYK